MLNAVKVFGLSIADLRTEEPDLEDVFMALTYARDGQGLTLPLSSFSGLTREFIAP